MCNNRRHTPDNLNLICQSISQIEQYTKHIAKADEFLCSPHGRLCLDGCVMRLQVIGETVRRLFEEQDNPLAGHQRVPWKAIIGLRNIISHQYVDVDEELIFNIIVYDLPLLKQEMDLIISEYKDRRTDKLTS